MAIPIREAWAGALPLADGATGVPTDTLFTVVIAARLPEASVTLADGRERPVPGRVETEAGTDTRIQLQPEHLAGSSRYRLTIAATPDGDSAWLPASLVFQTVATPPAPRRNLKHRSKNRR